jgi:methionyl-tRNA formyltransferase
MTAKKIILMGYGKGLVEICKIATKYFNVAGVFTQHAPFYEENLRYFENMGNYGLYEDIVEFCAKRNIDCFRSASVTDKDAMEWFRSKNADLIVCYSLWEVVKEPFFSICSWVCNVHGSIIPNLMGRAPQSWALLNGFDKIGLCVHQMTKVLDQGRIFKQVDVAINEDDLPLDIMLRQQEQLGPLMKSFFEDFLSEKLIGFDPDFSMGTYWPKISTDIDGRILWTEPGRLIERKIRAFNRPYAGAWCLYNGDRLRILSGKIEDCGFVSSFPGIVFRKNDSDVWISTIDGAVRITRVEYKGEIKSASELLRLGVWFRDA